MLVHVDLQFSFALCVYKDKPMKLTLARRVGVGRPKGESRARKARERGSFI